MKKLPFWQVFFVVGILFLPSMAQAQVPAAAETKSFFINLDQATIAKGYTVAAFEQAIKLSLIPGILQAGTGVDLLELHEPMTEPWNLDRVSEIYQFEFRNHAAYDDTKPFIVQINYQAQDDNLKQVYYFDSNAAGWKPLPTKDYVSEGMARAYIHLPFARVAVFSNPAAMAVGQASWYGYKNGLFAASPDFPKGSKLLVTNLANQKSVAVEVNDYGPDRKLHPERAIDLDKTAFKKIASLRDGVIEVSIEPLFITEQNGRVLGVKIDGVADTPEINSQAALLIDDNSQAIIYERNANAVLPLASLTKIVTASVFLDANPDFSAVVAYRDADAERTWEHADKNEIASLRLKDGDELTIGDLFFTTLIASTNNTAETLVRLSGLERAEFIRQMNAKARGWGATSTVFVEPTGLSPLNVSTVLDYAIMTKAAFREPKLLAATTLPEYKFTTWRDKKKVTARNTNKLIGGDFYVTGGKTGFLDEAGYCLMTKVKIGERELTGIIFGAPEREQSFIEMEDLLKYGIRQITHNR